MGNALERSRRLARVVSFCALCSVASCGDGGGASQGGAGAAAAPAVPAPSPTGDVPCGVAAIVQQHCAKCHGAPLGGGAAFALLRAADFQVMLNGRVIAQSALARIQDAARPMPPPPDARLSATEIATLQPWLSTGAPADTAGCAIATPSTGSAGTSGSSAAGAAGSLPAGAGGSGGSGGSAGSGMAGTGSVAPPTSGWSMFGRDLGNSRDNPDESVLSAETVPGLRRLWMHMGAGVTCAPAVVDGVVYVTEWDGAVFALRADDGSQVWKASLPDLIDSSPAVTATRVYVGDDVGVVHALDRTTGAEVWAKDVDAHAEAHLWSSPVPIEQAGLIVLGVASGEEALPAPHTFRGSVVALHEDSGEIAWQFFTTEADATAGPGVAVWGTPTVDTTRKLVYVGTGNNYEPPASQYADSMLAVDYETGVLRWSTQFTADDIFVVGAGATGPDFDVGSTANLFTARGKDLLGIGVKNGVYYALDRDTGIMQWMSMITEGAVLGGVISASAYANDSVFIASNRFAMGTTRTVALDAANGMLRWEHSAPMITYGGVAHANGVVYVATTSGSVFALAANDGRELWSDALPATIAGSPTVAGGMLLVPFGYQWTLRQGNPATGGVIAYGL